MRDGKVKVLYIAGYERSGSTLLHNVLGQLDGFFAAGELAKIWDRSLIENRRCGCGAPFRECEVWRRILTNGFGGVESIRARATTSVAGIFPWRCCPGTNAWWSLVSAISPST